MQTLFILSVTDASTLFKSGWEPMGELTFKFDELAHDT